MNRNDTDNRPLAERMRPQQLDAFAGQKHLLDKGKILWRLLEENTLPSLILWGPPGTGKTTLARILARSTGSDFIFFSAVLAGVKEIRQIIDEARHNQMAGSSTILFIDEIHRFNKSQQDAFLPHVESGLLTLIGATTENPSFQIIAPLLSRCRVLTLELLQSIDLKEIFDRALLDEKNGLGDKNVFFEDEAIDHIVNMADGDARRLLNSIEVAVSLAVPDKNDKRIVDYNVIKQAFQRNNLLYDTAGEQHYNLISALHKSLRDSDPDGSLYWLGRMIKSGEDPLYIARRMIRFASEDIGNADPTALAIAINARQTYHMLGSPEGELALAQAVIYLATAPKSNATYVAYRKVIKDIERTGSLPVPLHIRNAPTSLMQELGYGKGYKYAHDDPTGIVEQDHLPDELHGTLYYEPTNRGHEAIIKERLTKWRKILSERKGKKNHKIQGTS